MGESVQVIDRAFDILEYLSLHTESKGPSEIAKATELNKTTVYRILNSLQKRGYVDKNVDEGTYHLGVKLVQIVSNHINNLELQTEARPFLNELQSTLGLVVHLGILDHHEVIYAEKIDIGPNLRRYAQIGLRVPAQCSSLGKCLLAFCSGDEVDFYMRNCKFEAYTSNSITSLKMLKNQLRQVRLEGWGMDNEEYIPDHRCIGAPVYDYRGEVIAAISASGSKHQLGDDRIKEVVQIVKQTAADISKRLCYTVG